MLYTCIPAVYKNQNCSSLTDFSIPNNVNSIRCGIFEDCSALTSITIPNSVTTIEMNAFQNCSALNSISIQESVTSIGDYAFYQCISLTSIAIPNSVTSIGWSLFEGCRSLTSFTIPNTITRIGHYAFNNCEFLDDVTCLATTPPLIESDSFSRYGTLHVMSGCKVLYEATDVWKNFIIVEDGTDDIESITVDSHATDKDGKFLQNGGLFIRKAGKTYNIAGEKM